MKAQTKPFNAVRAGVIAFYILFASYIWRSLTSSYNNNPEKFYAYAALELLFLLLYALVMWRKSLPEWLLYVYFIFQSMITFYLVLIHPSLDYLTGFYVLLSYQGALILSGRRQWIWTGIFCCLIMASLLISFGWIKGLALALIPLAGCIAFPVYVIANREEERYTRESELVLEELQQKNARLQEYNSQAEQIATIEERNRLARELHDSVSQTMFSILLNTRAAQIIIDRHPDRLRALLDELDGLSQEALMEMRRLITQLNVSGSEIRIPEVESTEVLGRNT